MVIASAGIALTCGVTVLVLNRRRPDAELPPEFGRSSYVFCPAAVSAMPVGADAASRAISKDIAQHDGDETAAAEHQDTEDDEIHSP